MARKAVTLYTRLVHYSYDHCDMHFQYVSLFSWDILHGGHDSLISLYNMGILRSLRLTLPVGVGETQLLIFCIAGCPL